MYRAIPEINRICAMQDRSRRYKMHQETLKKIRNTSPSHLSMSNNQHQRSNSPKSYLRKGTHEEAYRINHENQKMKNAIANQSSALNRKDFNELDIDHKKQVARLLQSDYSYGFNNNIHKKRAQSKLSSTPSFKNFESTDENYTPNSNIAPILQPPKPAFIRENSSLFHLDFSKVVKDDL